MNKKTTGRRAFLQGAGSLTLGSSIFALAVPRGSWAARAADAAIVRSKLALGTAINITIFDEKENRANEAARDAFAEIDCIHDMMSTHQRYSMLSRVNHAAGNDALPVDARIAEVIASSLVWSRNSGGIFDVTTLPLLRAWGFRNEDDAAMESVEAARSKVGFQHIALEDGRLGLQHKGMEVDLGGIAKGYAIDRAVAILRDKWGIKSAIVDAGGDIYVLGRPVDAAGWTIGIADPRQAGPRNCATMEAADIAIATSGMSGTMQTRDGRTFTDKFNPMTGEPVVEFLSTTACAKTAMDADAASVALFAAGKTASHKINLQGVSWLGITASSNGELDLAVTGNFPTFERV